VELQRVAAARGRRKRRKEGEEEEKEKEKEKKRKRGKKTSRGGGAKNRAPATIARSSSSLPNLRSSSTNRGSRASG
jgi:hypothetical protein